MAVPRPHPRRHAAGWRPLLPVILLACPIASCAAEKHCETLKTSLTYSQDKAPRDISAVLPLIVEKVNRELEGVVDVEVGWTAGIHRRVGTHVVKCAVTRLLSAVGASRDDKDRDRDDDEVGTDEHGRDVVTQCFNVPFEILDTDECALPLGHFMRHRCAEPAHCVNTVGSYECVCPSKKVGGGTGGATSKLIEGGAADKAFFDGLTSQNRSLWDLAFNSKSESSCPGLPSTYSCCDAFAQGTEGSACRAAFRCPVDPCSPGGTNDCASNARCARSESPLERPNYDCKCPPGLMGNGRACRKGIDPKPRPMVMYDGVTPTAETLRNNFYCGCTKPIVDACAGFPKCEGKNEVCTVTENNTPICACKSGYVNNHDGFGCVDETPPVLKLRHDPDNNGINRLKQGDVYKEHAVDIDDDNAEEYLRSLKITYSRPLPPGCLAKIGQFHVNYTVATKWTTPPYVRVTRTVVVDDIDECTLDVDKYETQCPQLIPQCDADAGAKCVNTLGSYTCKCPRYTSGDGFKPISTAQRDGRGRFVDAPEGYSGGSGCRDTSKPVIEVLGPNPKVFRVAKCGGLSGIMSEGGSNGKNDADGDGEDDVEQLRGLQKGRYENDIKAMIQSTAGAELCATHARSNPSPTDCVRASDHTYRGVIDLSDRVTIGEPFRKSASQWSVPYDVVDDAGNKAATVWRDVVVEEVDLFDVERRIRDSVLADKEREIERAVAVAVEKERRKQQNSRKVEAGGGPAKVSGANEPKCPPCPECHCPATKDGLSAAQCKKICDQRIATEAHSCHVDPHAGIPKETLHPIVKDILTFFEDILSPGWLLTILLCSTAVAVMVIMQRILLVIFNPRDGYYYTKEDEERERAMLDAVTYYRSPEAATGRAVNTGSTPGSAPPRTSMSLQGGRGGGGAVGNGIFSPQENRTYGGGQRDDGGIYATMSPITPARSNGTPARTAAPSGTPYNLRRRY